MTDFRQCRQLWKTCFGDSDEFIDLYFSRRATENNTFTLTLPNGIVACQTQCLTYEVSEHNKTHDYTLGYISGLATLPAHRGHGYAQEVMHRMLSYMKQQGMDYSFLIPANEGVAGWYARHFGFSHTHNYTKFLLPATAMSGLQKMDFSNRELHGAAWDIISHFVHDSNHFLLQPKAYYIDQWEVCEMSGGGLYVLAPCNALLFIEIINERPVVLDIIATPLATTEEIKTSLGITQSRSVPILTLPVCASDPLPEDTHFSLLLD